jgi:hypothetical protein
MVVHGVRGGAALQSRKEKGFTTEAQCGRVGVSACEPQGVRRAPESVDMPITLKHVTFTPPGVTYVPTAPVNSELRTLSRKIRQKLRNDGNGT